MNIEIIAGSPRKGSLSYRVALHLHKKFQQEAPQHQTGLINMQDVQLPFVQSVWQTTEHIPQEYLTVGKRIFDAKALVLVSPEYNGGYSPAMKNFLDHFPKQTHKAFGLATSSPGILGGMRAAQQMLTLVPGFLGIASPTLMIVPMVDKKFAEDGTLLDESYQKNIDGFFGDFLWLAERLAAD
jgi:NAD(P)H-dependent FMN reductase